MKILCVTYGGGHVAMIAPVANRLKSLGHDVVILGLTTAETHLKRYNLDSIGFRNLIEPNDLEALTAGEKLVQDIDQSTTICTDESIAYLGLSYQDLVNRKGIKEAQRLYAKFGRNAFLPITILNRAINTIKPDVVIATNSPRAEQAAIIAAGNAGIPSVCINDLFASAEYLRLAQNNYASKICVLNDAVKNHLVYHGRNHADIVVTGNPAFDRLAEESTRRNGSALRIARGWSNKKVLLYASHKVPKTSPFMPGIIGDEDLPMKMESTLRVFAKNNDNFKLIIRYHPSQNISFTPGENVEHSPATEDLGELLYAIDAVTTMCSTVGLEAALIKKPVFTMETPIFSGNFSYSKMGISSGCDTLKDLPDLLQNWIDAETTLTPSLLQVGGATERIVSVIESLL